MYMKKKSKNNRYYRRTIDLFILLIFLLISLYTIFKAFNFGFIPHQWIFYAMIAFLVIFLLFFILALKKMPTWLVLLKRTFIIILCGLLGYGSYFMKRSESTFDEIVPVNADVNTKVFIISKKNHGFDSLDSLNNQDIGYQSGVDKENATFGLKQLQSTISDTNAIDEIDYTTLAAMLDAGDIQGLVISERFYKMNETHIENFKDTTQVLETYEKENTPVKSKKDITKDIFTVYISGLDEANSPDQKTRSDTNIVMIVNPIANHINMVSLPRDGYIPNIALDSENDKLTHDAMYGVENSVESIENFIGIPIDYYGRFSFSSLTAIVDAMGGVNVDVQVDLCEQDGTHLGTTVCVSKGPQTLNGIEALAYARHRKTENYDNPGRQRAQQQIIAAAVKKLISPSALSTIDKLMEISPNYVITNMENNQIKNFVQAELGELKPWTISSITSDFGVSDYQYTPTIDHALGPLDVYLFSKGEVQAIWNAYYGAKHMMRLNSFTFDLNNLYAAAPDYDDPNIMWDTMADDPH